MLPADIVRKILTVRYAANGRLRNPPDPLLDSFLVDMRRHTSFWPDAVCWKTMVGYVSCVYLTATLGSDKKLYFSKMILRDGSKDIIYKWWDRMNPAAEMGMLAP